MKDIKNATAVALTASTSSKGMFKFMRDKYIEREEEYEKSPKGMKFTNRFETLMLFYF